MKIKKMYAWSSVSPHYSVILTVDNRHMMFRTNTTHEITEKDLIPLPAYYAVGNVQEAFAWQYIGTGFEIEKE